MARARKTAATTSSNSADTIGKQQLKLVTDATKLIEKLTSLPETVETIKAEVVEIQNSFAYGVQETEAEAHDKKRVLDQQFKEYQENIDAQKSDLDSQLSEKKEAFQRELEALKYQHSLTIRDEDLNTVNNVASKHNKSLIDTDQLVSLQEKSKFNEEQAQEIRDTVAAETEKRVTQAKDAEIRNLKHSTEMEIAIARKDIDNLTKEVESLRISNEKLQRIIEEQNKNIVQVAEAATRPTNVYESSKK